MKLQRKYYPLACVCCIILVIFFSAVQSYSKKEGFTENINYFNNLSTRKIKTFKKDITKVKDEGFRSVKKFFRP